MTGGPIIRGMAWVTPLGAGLDEVWARLMAGEEAEPKPLANPESGRLHHYLPVSPKLVEALGRQPRLRRSSPLSYFAATAGLAALAHAGLPLELGQTARLAVIFAVSSGSVIYTRKFYEQVVKQGARAASPMLFPETVYNAPASHLSALLGIDGASYTLVGDGAIGLAALSLAEQMLALDQADFCLVVGTEEIDWVLCEGYRDGRFTTAGPKTELYRTPARGALLSEGGAALLLARAGEGPRLTAIHPGVPFSDRRGAAAALDRVCAELKAAGAPDCVVAGANGSSLDAGEAAALERHFPTLPRICPKAAWGENLGAGALQQVIVAAEALRRGELPPGRTARELRQALVLAPGVNQQAAGALVSR